MASEPFSYLISNPADLSEADVAYLERMLEQYPFCSLGYTLLAKGYASIGDRQATSMLHKAAAYSLSRNALRKLLSGEFPLARTPYTSISDLLEGRTPQLAYQQRYKKDDKAVNPLNGFGLDYSDVLFNEKKSKGPAKEKPSEAQAQLQQEQMDLIERFLSAEPKLGPLRAKPGKPDEQLEDLTANRVTFETSGNVTESLANLWAKQGKRAKAIEAYEKLSLKSPEKKAYFAGKIEELKNQTS